MREQCRGTKGIFFFFKGMKRDLKQFIRECEVCQKNKHDNTSPASLL
jgi:hypothetical protein